MWANCYLRESDLQRLYRLSSPIGALESCDFRDNQQRRNDRGTIDRRLIVKASLNLSETCKIILEAECNGFSKKLPFNRNHLGTLTDGTSPFHKCK